MVGQAVLSFTFKHVSGEKWFEMALGASEYAFINARVRGLKSKMLTLSQYEKLIQASDLDEAVRFLSATPYWGELSKALSQPPIDVDQVDIALRRTYAKEIKSLINSAPAKAKKFLLKYQKRFHYENIKAILRVIHSGESKDQARKHLVVLAPEEDAEYERLLTAQTIPQLVDRIPDPRLRRQLQDALQMYEATRSTMPLEVELDKYFYKEIWTAIDHLRAMDRRYARAFFGLRIGIINIMTVIRAKLQGIEPQIIESLIIPITYQAAPVVRELLTARNIEEALNMLIATPYRELAHKVREAYRKSPTLSSVEHAFEEHLVQTAYLSMAGFPFQIGTVLAYLDLKYYELRNIKIIIIGKEENVNPATIRELLVVIP
nr:hypothetical protein [Candidatus Bathyarchaeota archaeon]